MSAGDLTFAALAANPFGGLLLAIPFGFFQMHYAIWKLLIGGVAFSYVQVIAVDLGWSALMKLQGWRTLMERRRSRTAERLLTTKGGFWATFIACPLIGPWLVMAFVRYARVPHRRVALPIVLSLTSISIALTAVCMFAPHLIPRR